MNGTTPKKVALQGEKRGKKSKLNNMVHDSFLQFFNITRQQLEDLAKTIQFIYHDEEMSELETLKILNKLGYDERLCFFMLGNYSAFMEVQESFNYNKN